MLQRALAVFVAVCGVLAAQDPPSRAARISYVSGAVSFEPAGVTDWAAATINRPLTTGDQLYADNGARAEVHLPGVAFRLGDRTAFEFMNLDDQSTQVRLSEGALDVRVRNLAGNIEIDTPNMAFTVSRPGEYRIDTNPDNGQTLVTDRDGEGQVIAGGGSFTIQPGQQAVIVGQDQSAQYQINPAPALDSFDHWVMSRNSRDDRYARSQYVSTEMVGYEDLGEYGNWRSVPDYGEVWVPNGVAAGWAPYTDGHWAWVDPWGWTWVDDEPWGFAPFHYGRWAFVNGYWGWCPGPVAVAPVYAPALVAWVGFGAGFGVSIGVGGGPAVGWFPLGPRDVYIPAFSASAAFVNRINVTNTRVINTTYVNNVYNGYLRTRSIPVASYMNRSVPGAVVSVPQNAFVGARPVRQVAVRLKPNQIAGIRVGEPAPHVAPQVASVLGHPAAGRVPRPAAGVLSRPVLARTAPPPSPPSFQRRQAALARNPGRPLPVAQLRQLASSGRPAVATRPPVRVATQVRPVTPQMAHGGAPASRPIAPAGSQPHNGVTPPPARNAPVASGRATSPAGHAPNPYQAQQRPQQHPAPAPMRQQPQRQAPAAQAQQRPFAPPARQPRVQAQQHPAPTPMRQQPQRQAPAAQAQQRPYAPPARQPGTQAPHQTPARPSVQAQHRTLPAPQAERQMQPAPRPQVQRAPAAPPRPSVQAQHRTLPAPQAERQMQPAPRPQVQHQAAPARPQVQQHTAPAPRIQHQAAPAPRPQPQHKAAPPREPPQKQAPPERHPPDHR